MPLLSHKQQQRRRAARTVRVTRRLWWLRVIQPFLFVLCVVGGSSSTSRPRADPSPPRPGLVAACLVAARHTPVSNESCLDVFRRGSTHVSGSLAA